MAQKGLPQEHRKLRDITIEWLPKNFHELLYAFHELLYAGLYAGLTIYCVVEIHHTGGVPLQLMALWSAAAAQVGVPGAKDAFTELVARTLALKTLYPKHRQSTAP